MNNLVFITGAGFSRPHGLPLMSDFYEISRELFDANPDKYSHFEEVFLQATNRVRLRNTVAGITSF